jgi:hypothetical protein
MGRSVRLFCHCARLENEGATIHRGVLLLIRLQASCLSPLITSAAHVRLHLRVHGIRSPHFLWVLGDSEEMICMRVQLEAGVPIRTRMCGFSEHRGFHKIRDASKTETWKSRAYQKKVARQHAERRGREGVFCTPTGPKTAAGEPALVLTCRKPYC